MSDFRIDTRVTLLHDIPTHHAGEHGTIHDTYNSDRGQWVGVCFDNAPHLIRYVEPIDLAPATHDVADVTRAAEDAVLHIIESAWDLDTPCNAQPDCANTAVWWWDCTCGVPRYACEPHRARYDDWHATRTRACKRCRSIIPNPVPWRAL